MARIKGTHPALANARDILKKSGDVVKSSSTGAKTKFVGTSDRPDAMTNRQLVYLEDLKKILKRPSLTPKVREEIEDIVSQVESNYSKTAKIVDKIGDPDTFPTTFSDKQKSTVGNAQQRNAARQLDSKIRNPSPGLLGMSVPETPPPGMPPKATRSVPGIIPKPEPFTPRSVGTARDRLLNPRSRSARSGRPTGSLSPAYDPITKRVEKRTKFHVGGPNAGKIKSGAGRGPSIQLPSRAGQRASALPPWTESPAPPPLRAQSGATHNMIPDGRPMGTDAINMDATKEYDPK